MLVQCWPSLQANMRRWPNAGPMLAHCLRRWTSMTPANTEQSPDVVSMAGQRQRRWANIETVLGEWHVFGEKPGTRPHVCWAAIYIVFTAGDEYKPTPTQCLLNVGQASPVLASIYSALGSTSCWRYWCDALSQSWGNVGPPSVTLDHIQRGAKHHTVTRYWANAGSTS